MQTVKISRPCAEAIGKVLARFDLPSNRNRYVMGQAEIDLDMILKLELLNDDSAPVIQSQLTINSKGAVNVSLIAGTEEIKLEVKE